MRGLGNVFKGAVFLAGLGVAASALAQADPGVTITVVPAPGSEVVSLSRPAPRKNTIPLETYSAFNVTLSNGGNSTLNRIEFSGTALTFKQNQDGTTTPDAGIAIYDGYIAKPGDVCTGIGATVACALMSLAPGDSTAFTIIFKTPETGSLLDLSYTGGGKEGSSTSGNGCCSQSGTALSRIELKDPATDPNITKRAYTFMNPKGFKLFTGAGAVSTGTDGWTTIIEVPSFAAAAYQQASIVEDSKQTSCAPYAKGFEGCFTSDVSIPGFAVTVEPGPLDPKKLLQITIRRDKDFFALGNTKPADVKLYYYKTPESSGYELRLCSLGAPTADQPCLAEPPKILRNSDTPDKELWGDLEFRVLAIENGRYGEI